MTPSSTERAQTDPLAALVAVSAFVVGVGLYGVYIGDTLPGTSDRTPERTAIDRVWSDLEESGVFYAHNAPQNISDEISTESLPQGAHVHISVRTYSNGAEIPIAEARFDTDGEPLPVTAVGEPPARASAVERPIPVTVTLQAAVRSGSLRVEVWS